MLHLTDSCQKGVFNTALSPQNGPVPPLLLLDYSGTEGKSSFLVKGSFRSALLSVCTQRWGQGLWKSMLLIRKLPELNVKPNPICILRLGGALNFGTCPKSLTSSKIQTTRQKKKKMDSLPPCPLLLFFLLNPSKKDQGTGATTLSYDRSLVL